MNICFTGNLADHVSAESRRYPGGQSVRFAREKGNADRNEKRIGEIQRNSDLSQKGKGGEQDIRN
jgi:hypothetical protein